jgi:phosphoribosylformylglycinamidine cyclo-ligase
MPGLYQEGEYDLAGFVVGVVDNSKIVDGSEIRVGHKVVGIASSGLHSNGYSLVRKVCFDLLKLKIDTYIPDFGRTLGEELLTPTIIYSETIQSLLKDLPIHGLAHITGGGITDNILRIIPNACRVVMRAGSWDVPPVFTYLQQAGKISDAEMLRTFNNGVGLIAVVQEDAAQEMLERLRAMNEKAFIIGEIDELKSSDSRIEWIKP